MSHGPEPRRIAYGPGEHHFGDLRVPAGAGPHPVILSIHGGFWKARYGLDLNDPLSAWFAARGCATWNIEYRRVGHEGGGWPGTFLDAAAAADHLRELAGPNQLDLSRVVAIGHSAGGHLALWLAGRHKLPATSPLYTPNPLPLRGVLSLAGVTDLELMFAVHQREHRPLAESPVPCLLGAVPSTVPERVADGSPICLAPLGVPTVLVNGMADETVPVRLAEAYAAVAGPEAQVLALPGVEHFKVINPEAADAWPQIAAAMARLLGAEQGWA